MPAAHLDQPGKISVSLTNVKVEGVFLGRAAAPSYAPQNRVLNEVLFFGEAVLIMTYARRCWCDMADGV